jgi:hypothetical protein
MRQGTDPGGDPLSHSEINLTATISGARVSMSTDQDDLGGRNPPWSQDELIVVLDFYLQHSPSIPSKTSNEVIELSALLNRR